MAFAMLSSCLLFVAALCWANVRADESLLVRRTTPPPEGGLCSITGHRLTILDDRLFFMAGKYQFEGSEEAGWHERLFWLNLNDTFPVENPLPAKLVHSVETPEEVPVVHSGSFFIDNTTMYIYAGWAVEEEPDRDSMWSFNTSTDTWKNVPVRGGDFNFGKRYLGLTASVPTAGLSFFAGGSENYTTGMLKFNASVAGSPRWTNLTDGDGSNGEPIPNLFEGQMVYVGAGTSGVLLAFGGYDASRDGEQLGEHWKWDQSPMDRISVYDVESSRWFEVVATGDIPPLRSLFCAGVSRSPDDSSFQVTIYAGFDLASGEAMEDVYVLAVPAFTWIRIRDKNNEEARESGIGRKNHRCAMWNDGEMIVVGGEVLTSRSEGSTELNTASCNPAYPAIRVLDTSTYEWTKRFDPRPTYRVPPVVYGIIGGDAQGGATLTRPDGGFNDTRLNDIFAKRVPRAANDDSSPSPTPTRIPSSQPQHDGDGEPATPVGAIVGGSVGGLALIALLGGAAFFFWRRRRRHASLSHHHHHDNEDLASPFPPAAASSSSPPLVEITGDLGPQRQFPHLHYELDGGGGGGGQEDGGFLAKFSNTNTFTVGAGAAGAAGGEDIHPPMIKTTDSYSYYAPIPPLQSSPPLPPALTQPPPPSIPPPRSLTPLLPLVVQLSPAELDSSSFSASGR